MSFTESLELKRGKAEPIIFTNTAGYISNFHSTFAAKISNPKLHKHEIKFAVLFRKNVTDSAEFYRNIPPIRKLFEIHEANHLFVYSDFHEERKKYEFFLDHREQEALRKFYRETFLNFQLFR